MFVGYDENVKGYRVFFPENEQIECIRDVMFIPDDENETKDQEGQKINENDSTERKINEEGEKPEDNRLEKTPKPEQAEKSLENKRKIKRPSFLEDYETSFIGMLDESEPKTYEEAISGEDRKFWIDAIKKEIESLEENNTWTLVEEPKNTNVVDSKWVFKLKRNNDDKVIQYKARLVARGFQQKDINLDEIYTPVAKLTTLRILLNTAVQEKWVINQMDVKSAFLYGEIDEEIYMILPEGVNSELKYCKLNKSIYGLKKSPRNWYKKFSELMESENFKRSKSDYCLYFKKENNIKIYVLLYVDDMVIVGSNQEIIHALKTVLYENFKMKDLGEITNYLGINIKYDFQEGVITLKQSAYLNAVLKRFEMDKCKSASTPMDPNFDHASLKREKSESADIENKCRTLIGCLMYVMLGTRPDICASISILSRYQNCASNELIIAIKRVLRYIRGTIDYGLIFKRTKNPKLIGFVDADWGGDLSDRKSTTGYVFTLGSGTICWSSRKQPSVALSSTEAEYVALSIATSEAMWLKNLCCDCEIINKSDVVQIYEDNQSAIKLAKNNDTNKRLKHVDIRFHFVREKVNEKAIDLNYIESQNQLADMFTKPLTKVKIVQCCEKLMIKEIK